MIDETDKKILRLLQENAQITIKEINLSMSPVHDRIKKLEADGVIEKYVTILDKKKVGKNLTVFCQITLIKQTHDTSEEFNKSIMQLPEVLECHFVSGTSDYLLKITVPDMESYHEFHQKKLSMIPTVSLIHSFFVMSEVKNTTVLDL
jgi:Lrp/AsnC family transcriptional regulator, leucine-responsive regulatory protein